MRQPLLSRTITRGFVLLTLIFFLLLAGFGCQVSRNRELARDGKEAHDALCVLKADLIRRHAAGVQFLKDNPGGVLGLPRGVLITSLMAQQSTINSLSRLDCVPPPEPKTTTNERSK